LLYLLTPVDILCSIRNVENNNQHKAQRTNAMTTTTTKTKTTKTTPEWKWNNSISRDALTLPQKGFVVDNNGVVYNGNDGFNPIGFVAALPNGVRVTKLEWVVTQEEKKEIITCQKLTGSHKKTATPARRKESPDGMRGGNSQWGEVSGPKSHFVADEYEVAIIYMATKAVNQFGEIVEGKPKFPSATTIAYETGYGKTTEYFITDLASLDLPAEKTEKVYTDQREHFYQEAIKFLSGVKAEKEDTPAYDCGLKPGDVVRHHRTGDGVVKSVSNYKNKNDASLVVKFKEGDMYTDASTVVLVSQS
jgi:hypothetical protein